jgi:hypothetical protein
VSTIEIDGLNEEDFRRSIENRLREGRGEAAIGRLRPLLAPYAGPGGLLPERFLTIEPTDLVLTGWDGLHDAVRRRDMPGRRITAISIAFAWPEGDAHAPDEEGRLRPHIETGYYSDNAYPFSQSGRDDLLEGYSFYGCAWSGDCEASDNTISVEGIDDLHGALAALEARLLASDEPDDDGIRAGSLGACLLSALLIEAVAQRVARDGTPRPLCVMAGSSGVYPYFDAPVAGMPELARKLAEEAEEEEEQIADTRGVPAPRYSSLLLTGIPRARKRAVLVLDQDDDLSDRIAQLRLIGHGESEAGAAPQGEPAHAPTPDDRSTEAAPAPDVLPATMAGSPLLTKKGPRHGQSLHELLGLTEPEGTDGFAAPLEPDLALSASEDPPEPPRWDDWADWDEPASPAPEVAPTKPELAGTPAHYAASPEPGFDLLAGSPDSWSQGLLVAKPLPDLLPSAEPEQGPAEPVDHTASELFDAQVSAPVAHFDDDPVLSIAPEEVDRPADPPRLSLREKLCTEPDFPAPQSLASRLAGWLRGLFAR